MSDHPLAPPDAKSRMAPWVEGMLLAMIVLVVVSMSGQAVRTSYHGYLHTTLGEGVLRDGLLPENPYHAEAPLRYYTLYPTLGVLLGRLGMGSLWGFAVLNLLAALLLGPALDALGRRLSLSFWGRRLAFLGMVVGFNGFGYYFGGNGAVPVDGAQPLLILREFTLFGEIAWDARLQSFLPKLFNVSSFALALPLALAALAQLLGAMEHPQRKLRLQAGGLLGLATAINPLVGLHTGLLFAVMVLYRMQQRKAWKKVLLEWLPVAALAVLVAIPFLMPLLQAAPVGAPQQSPQFPFAGDGAIWNLLGPLAALVVLSLPAWWRWPAQTRLFVGSAVGFAVVMSFLELPWDNQYKFPRVAGLFLALPLGMALVPNQPMRSMGKGALAWMVVGVVSLLAMVPTSYRTVEVYAAWTDADLLPLSEVDGGRLALKESDALRSFPPKVAAAEEALEPNTVLVMHPRHPVASGAGMGASGNRLAPVLHHSLFVDTPQIHNQEQPDLRRRLDLVTSLWEGRDWSRKGPGTREMDRVASLEEIRLMMSGRGIAILSLEGEASSHSFFMAAGGELRAQENGVTLWWFAPLQATVAD